MIFSVIFASMAGTLLLRRQRTDRAIEGAQRVQRALTAGQQRYIEESLRGELALVEAGEAVSREREWLARAQLGGLLVAEWRLEEAREVYEGGRSVQNPQVRSVTEYGRHELDVLTQTPSDEKLEAIRQDRIRVLRITPREYHRVLSEAWTALEGLCLIRMGRAREGAPMIAQGLRALGFSPSRVVYLYHLGQAYEHIGELPAAIDQYKLAQEAFPGTRLANEAKTRLLALSPGTGHGESIFRSLMPELPQAQPYPSLGPGEVDETDRNGRRTSRSQRGMDDELEDMANTLLEDDLEPRPDPSKKKRKNA